MKQVHIRPTHYTYHREGLPPRLRIQSDAQNAYVRLEFAGRAQLFHPHYRNQRTAENYFDSWAGGSGINGQQLRLSHRKLTYNMPLVVWRKLGQTNHLIYFRAIATTQLPPNWSAGPPTTVTSLHDKWAWHGWGHNFKIPHDRLHDPWVFPDMASYNKVPAFYRAKLELLTRHRETHEGAHLLRRLAGHDNYTALPGDQRTKALYVFAATNNAARRAILQLFSRMIQPTTAGGSATPAVRNTDLSQQHNTLLDNLAKLVEIDPHMDIRSETMATVIADVLEEVANPHYELNQGTKNTCVPTSVQWIIATYFPAEYVRLMLTLLTQQMRATLANSDVGTVPPDTYELDAKDILRTLENRYLCRSWSERIFQATMMNYARPGLTYSNLRDIFTDEREPGLTNSELIRIMKGLRNRTYIEQRGAGLTLINNIVQRLQAPSLPILTGMQWGPPNDRGGHEVVSVKADANNVTFRNPWGPKNYRVGQQHQDPPRRSTNPSRGEETMTRADMANWIIDIVVEQ